MHSRLIKNPLGAWKLFVLIGLVDKKRTVVLADCLMPTASFFFQIALYLRSWKMVFSQSVILFFYSNLIINTILAYVFLILRNIAVYRSILVFLVEKS